ncbi:MAG: PhzF family phenazine biosynthesis protein [Pseudomonadota bacterium]
MHIAVHRVDAFQLNGRGGNPAGVVLDADGVSDAQMQQVAAKVGAPETAFVLASHACDFRLRFFTPAAEVGLCGHATVATYALLHRLGRVRAGAFRQELQAGELGVAVADDGLVSMEQTLPVFGDTFSPEHVAPVLGCGVEDLLGADWPVQVVSTGLPDVLVPVRSPEALAQLKPDFEAMARFNTRSQTVGFHVFSIDTSRARSFARCRNFAPRFGIPEEAATGSASGALACYLHRYGEAACTWVFEQGHALGRPSQIQACVDVERGAVSRVTVSGYAGSAVLTHVEVA